MIDRPRLRPAERREKRSQAMRRYEKQRRLNMLAKPGPHEMIIVLDNLKAAVARISAEAAQADPARLEQELALIAVKTDVAEELDRLDAGAVKEMDFARARRLREEQIEPESICSMLVRLGMVSERSMAEGL